MKGTFHVTDDISAYREADAIIAVQTPVDENHILGMNLFDVLPCQYNMKRRPICSNSVAPGTTNHLAKPILTT
jgi:UDP-N-acetyl-D-mannosaminuronate dehydrogenase